MSWVVTLGERAVPLEDLPESSDALGLVRLERQVWQLERAGRRYTLVLLPHGAGLELWWRGRRYPVRLERRAVHALRRHFKVKQSAALDGHAVVAHMPGLVTQVKVREGQSVRRGEGLIVLEAMKMENELRAPADGVVHKLRVRPGQHVEKGQTLCQIGPA